MHHHPSQSWSLFGLWRHLSSAPFQPAAPSSSEPCDSLPPPEQALSAGLASEAVHLVAQPEPSPPPPWPAHDPLSVTGFLTSLPDLGSPPPARGLSRSHSAGNLPGLLESSGCHPLWTAVWRCYWSQRWPGQGCAWNELLL